MARSESLKVRHPKTVRVTNRDRVGEMDPARAVAGAVRGAKAVVEKVAAGLGEAAAVAGVVADKDAAVKVAAVKDEAVKDEDRADPVEIADRAATGAAVAANADREARTADRGDRTELVPIPPATADRAAPTVSEPVPAPIQAEVLVRVAVAMGEPGAAPVVAVHSLPEPVPADLRPTATGSRDTLRAS